MLMRIIAFKVMPAPGAPDPALLARGREARVEFYQRPDYDVIVGADVGKASHGAT